jgi:hypothetical protein
VDQELLGQILIIFAQKQLFEDGTGIPCMPKRFLGCPGMVCGMSISNAILWTHFVTPCGNQTQQDQTDRVSNYKKERTEESGKFEYNSTCPGPVRTCGLLFVSKECCFVFQKVKSERATTVLVTV